MIRCWVFGGAQTLAILPVLLDQPPRGEGQTGRSGVPELLWGAANPAQCHQQLPILGIKHTGAQELGRRPEVVVKNVVEPSWA